MEFLMLRSVKAYAVSLLKPVQPTVAGAKVLDAELDGEQFCLRLYRGPFHGKALVELLMDPL